MESRKQCAYNHTRECFLGLEINAADISFANLTDTLAKLALKSGEGLWLTPFRGFPETGMSVPVDLIYLDEANLVIDVVESFPTFRVDPSSRQASSVLILPTHSIYSSQTQSGDLLVICVAEEMEHRLEEFYGSSSAAEVVQSAVLLRETPLWSGGPGVLQLKNRTTEELPEAEQTHEMDLVEPGKKIAWQPKNWLQRWWSPDPRKAPREPSSGLAAYFWNGGAPQAHNIKDISSTGLYVVTEERWYPGTLILMTLQKTANGEESAERTISVHTRAVRWGKDGVGLQFILPDDLAAHNESERVVSAVDRKELDRFLRQLNKRKS
ncbi:MAG: hypothetical protein P4K94_05555 [Terracidiphilus sp.]|nr:hypothetical protein [Terracidiphilus sp.]